MKTKDYVNELREKNAEELASVRTELLREQFGLRMQKANGEFEKTHLLAEIRKKVAQINTVISEKAGQK